MCKHAKPYNHSIITFHVITCLALDKGTVCSHSGLSLCWKSWFSAETTCAWVIVQAQRRKSHWASLHCGRGHRMHCRWSLLFCFTQSLEIQGGNANRAQVHISLVPRPIPSFSMFHADRRELALGWGYIGFIHALISFKHPLHYYHAMLLQLTIVHILLL